MDGKFEDYDELVMIDGIWSITHSDTQETDTLTNIDLIKFVDRIESLQMQTEDFEFFSIDSGIQTITKLTGTNFDDNIAVTVSDDKVIKTNGGSDTIVVEEGFAGKVQITDLEEDFDTLSFLLNDNADPYIESIRMDGGVFSFETSHGGDVIMNGQDAPYTTVSFEAETNTDNVLLVDSSAITQSNQYVFDDNDIDKIIIDVAGQFVSEDWIGLNIIETEDVGKISLDGFDLVFNQIDATTLSNLVEII
jgi:hypothetical protein